MPMTSVPFKIRSGRPGRQIWLILALSSLYFVACGSAAIGEPSPTPGHPAAPTIAAVVSAKPSPLPEATLPTVVSTAAYTDHVFGLAFDIPAAWEVDGFQGAAGQVFALTAEGASQNVLTFSLVTEGDLDAALNEVQRGAWGPYIRQVQPIQLGELEALRLELSTGEGRPPLVWLVATPAGRALSFIPGGSPAPVEPVLATLRAVPVRELQDLPTSALPLLPTSQPLTSALTGTGQGTAISQAGWQTYTNPDFQVTFQYPAGWQPVPGYEARYGGPDGFFQVSALSGLGLTVAEACELEATHRLQPYGSQPQVGQLRIQGQEACLILPSADQGQEMMEQAALVARYPQTISIAGERYDYFILMADRTHLERIALTLNLGP